MKPAAQVVAERYIAAWNARDLPAIADLWQPGGTEVFPAFSRSFEAPNELAEHLSDWFEAAPDVVWDPESVVAQADSAVVLGSLRGTWQGRFQDISGRGVSFEFLTVDALELSEGLIARNVCLFDQGAMLRCLGLFPSADSRLDRLMKRSANALLRLRRPTSRRDHAQKWGLGHSTGGLGHSTGGAGVGWPEAHVTTLDGEC